MIWFGDRAGIFGPWHLPFFLESSGHRHLHACLLFVIYGPESKSFRQREFLAIHFKIENLSLYCSVCSVVQHVWLFATPWTVAHQAPLSKGFSRHEYWSGLPFPTPWSSKPGIEPMSPVSPALAGGFCTAEPPGKPLLLLHNRCTISIPFLPFSRHPRL